MKHEIKPLVPVSTEGLEETARDLLEGKPEESDDEIDAARKEGFIYIPTIKACISKKRDLNGLSWNKAIDKIYNQGVEVKLNNEGIKAEMPTPFEFMSGLIYVLDNENIPDLTSNERTEFLDDILKTGNYRGNHLNARFIEGSGFNGLGIETATFDSSGRLNWKSKPLETCLNENCYADIRKINSQGLFTTKSANQNYTQGENAYFWTPVKDKIAARLRFLDNSARIGLHCGGNPDYTDA